MNREADGARDGWEPGHRPRHRGGPGRGRLDGRLHLALGRGGGTGRRGGRARTRAPSALDARDRPRAAALVAEVESSLGPIGALVNNAGIQRDTLLALTSDEQWDEILDVNVGGVFRCCRAVLPGMITRRAGAIVNVASLSAIRGRPGQAAYAASKAAVVGLTRALSREVGQQGSAGERRPAGLRRRRR